MAMLRGESVLRASLARYASERGIWASREQVVIGASVQSLLYQLCGLLEHGQSAALQQGAYRQAQRVFEDYRHEGAAPSARLCPAVRCRMQM